MPEPIATLNEESLRADLRELIRKTVEEMLGGLLEEEAGDLVGAERCERAEDREACRAGRCERKLATTSGEATIRMPKLKGMRFTTAVIERCRRRQRRRAAEPRDPRADPRRGDVPRRGLRPHARHRTAEVRRGERAGAAPLPGRDAAGRAAAPDGGPMGLSESAQES